MRGQDVWVGLPYDLVFTTTLHELVAGWLGAELGTYHHHIDSLHIYERDLDQAADLTNVASYEMAALTTPWEGFDKLLRQVEDGDATGHPGWDAVAETMRNYQLWKAGDREQARRSAQGIEGPLGHLLSSWYRELERRGAVAARPGRGAA